MKNYNEAIEIVAFANTEIANLKDYQVTSKSARAIREIARTNAPEEFVGTISEMVAKFPSLFAENTNTSAVADHNPEDVFAWVISVPVGRKTLRVSDFSLAPIDEVSK